MRMLMKFKRKSLLYVIVFAFTAISVFLFSSCSKKQPDQKIKRIVLISLDTCRADHLSCYGYSENTTPNIDALAEEGIIFENVLAQVPITLPSHSSIMTGTIPPRHGVHNNFQKLPENSLTLAEILSEAGYATGGIAGAFVLDGSFGIAQGFDSYKDEFPESSSAHSYAERMADEVSQYGCEWIEKHKNENFFLFLHYYDPHIPYRPPEPFAERFADNLYAGEIAFTDDCLGQVLAKLKELGLYESTLIVVTGDHGEMLGEHGENTHGYLVYQSAIQVPLIFKLPQKQGGIRISHVASLTDIFPTILTLVGISNDNEIQGQDLSPSFEKTNASQANQRYLYCESLTPTIYACNPLLSLIDWPWKYIYTTRPELYNCVHDPQEQNNVAQKEQLRCKKMLNRLQYILEENLPKSHTKETGSLNQSSINKLESLGYVGGNIDESFELDMSKPDPKDFVHVNSGKEQLVELLSHDKYEKALKLGSSLVKDRPGVGFLYELTGRAAIGSEDYNQAIFCYTKYLAFRPLNTQARNNLATSYERTGKIEEAVLQWKEIIRIEPDHFLAHKNLGTTLYNTENIAEAVKYWEQAVKIRPGAANLLNSLAWIMATSNDPALRNPPRAVKLSQQACDIIKYKKPVYLDTLAVAYGADKQFSKAIETAQEAIQLAREGGNNELAERINGRLEYYLRNESYIDK
jgi:arylsulfatase A-like enzyme